MPPEDQWKQKLGSWNKNMDQSGSIIHLTGSKCVINAEGAGSRKGQGGKKIVNVTPRTFVLPSIHRFLNGDESGLRATRGPPLDQSAHGACCCTLLGVAFADESVMRCPGQECLPHTVRLFSHDVTLRAFYSQLLRFSPSLGPSSPQTLA